MKKLIFTLFCLLIFSIAGFSQYYRFGIKVGVTSDYMRFSNEDERYRSRKTGFHIGGLNHFQLGEHFAMQSHFQLAVRGGNLHNIKFTTWHFETPVNFLYTDGGFFLGGGPYVSFGLGGTEKGENPDTGGWPDIFPDEKHNFLFRQPEGGLNAVVGFYIGQNLLMQANFAHGLHSLAWGEDGYRILPKHLGLSMAYLFGETR